MLEGAVVRHADCRKKHAKIAKVRALMLLSSMLY